MSLSNPRFESLPELNIAGQAITLGNDPASAIPALWQRIGAELGNLPGCLNTVSYGLCLRPRESGVAPDYVAGREVGNAFAAQPPWCLLRLPGARYAVFTHRGPLSALQHTVGAIFHEWLPHSGCTPTEGTLAFFERYGTNFDTRSGQGDVEIWLPVTTPTRGDER